MKRVALVTSLLFSLVGNFAAAAQPQLFQIIVHPSNPSTSIDSETASRFFLRRSRAWQHGPTVRPVDHANETALFEAFSRQVHGKAGTAIESFWLKQIFSGDATPPAKLSSDREIVLYVGQHPGAIGYVSSSTRLNGVKRLDLVDEEADSSGSERGRIDSLLSAYSRAMERKDMAGLLAIWPNMGADRTKAIRESFRFAKKLVVRLDIEELRIDANKATVICARRDELDTGERRPIVSETRAVLRLRKSDGSWFIESISGS